MPTSVATARQYLTTDAAHALDEAVNVARRRGHGQTTSLHAVSALLALPSSSLRDACVRARNSAYSPRLQFKALELCLSVSLDRVPSGQVSDEPPVSNSFMAAIKRSQANQRRQPENYHFYQQISQQQSSSSISCVKVELRNLILSILDDPLVSRVFGEAGFRSSEIKLAIIRPLHQVFKSSRYKGRPLFLHNLSENLDSGLGSGGRGFNFPFQGFTDFTNGDENCKRIGEVMSRNKGKNPLLVGSCAYDALASFTKLLQKRKQNILPVQLCGLSLICIENDIAKFISGGSDKRCLDLRFREVGQLVEQNLGPGLVVKFGDLKAFIDHNDETVTYVVGELTTLLQLHDGKLWLIGAAGNNETYVKFVGIFPSVEKEWDLQLLPITSSGTSTAESFPKSSLMESFVPFGGFFSTPSEINGSLSNSCHCLPRCHVCNKKCEQEVLALSKGGFTASITDQYQSTLSTWLQMAELGRNKGLDLKTRDDGEVLSTIVSGLQKKWDNICQRLHHSQSSKIDIHPSHFPTIMGFQLVDDKDYAKIPSSNDMGVPAAGNRCSCIPSDLQKMNRKQDVAPSPVVFEAKSESLMSKQGDKHLNDDLEPSGLRIPCSFSNSGLADGSQASPKSTCPLAIELNLRISSLPIGNELIGKTGYQKEIDHEQDKSSCLAASIDIVNESVSGHLAQLSSSECHFELTNRKKLFRTLTDKVSWQEEAICIISEVVLKWRTKNEKWQGESLRRDLWFTFLGPDRCAKRKVATALAQIIRGKDNFISADLNPEDGTIQTFTLFGHHDAMFRGKTVVDYVAGELSKKPLSIVFLENLDKADMQARTTLSHAIETGKFSDSHGREVGINNAIFITTSSFAHDKIIPSRKDKFIYTEEMILNVKGRSMQILVEPAHGSKIGQNLPTSAATSRGIFGSVRLHKRKLVGMNQNLSNHELSDMVKREHKMPTRNLDLNLPAEGNDKVGTDDFDSDPHAFLLDSSKSWLHSFFEKVDSTVMFRPFDFDTLAEKILKEINGNFHKTVGLECLLEVDRKVMEQLLAAAYLSENDQVVKDWVEQVLNRAFVEVSRKYNLGAHCVVKLGVCEENLGGGHLPTKIFFT
ncbi:hypothetical protein K2173_002926 [Erythroxylum novogranatense]|uniref:Clp R domain-containing protein n=1 Tax=Erythroxylum novogranatense TaxID=1862640 RepID=A0AAV8TR47_9ROSI|nr:hypothetical protein K2173_002926 [Erythroxylum novogranatense]